MFLKTCMCMSGRIFLNNNASLKHPIANGFTRNYATIKRFYKKTGILHSGDKFEVILDQRKLKTPRGTIFSVDSEPLALAVASEWDSQKTNIIQSSMHLTTLCNTIIDNPNKLNKFDMANYVMDYMDTDTVLFHTGEDDALYKFQQAEWDPIIQWFCDRFQVDLQKCRDISGPTVTAETKAAVSKYILSHNFAAVNGFIYGIDTLKSVILLFACVERFITPEKAVLLSRLEEEYQSEYWGRVEWSHDLSQQDLQARLSATILFIYFNTTSSRIQIKNVAKG